MLYFSHVFSSLPSFPYNNVGPTLLILCFVSPNFTQVTKKAALGAAAAGTKAAKDAASAGTKAATDVGRRVTTKARDSIPNFGSYISWTGRRIVLVIFGTAFVYGMGSSLPGAVSLYYVEKDRRREGEERRREGEREAVTSEQGGEEDGPFSSAQKR